MCGICGIVDFSGRPIDTAMLVRMRDIMACRGPDDAGLYQSPSGSPVGVALGHRRLAIIDLSPAGRQPMDNEDGTIQLVLNGEIYNFLELRGELEGSHKFHSRTDTEVLIHGYEEWGLAALVRRIRGMFAFAIWDSRRCELHLVRDHLGKKPLFYRAANNRVEFSSDIKSLWTISPQTPELDERAIDEFLYYSVIGQARTIFKGISKLPPASFATFRSSEPEVIEYWSPDYTRKETHRAGDWLEGIDHHLRTAVKRRMIADVPLGAFLSGGVDSSTVCTLMAKEGSTKPKTFSAVFKGHERFDEGPFSRAVAEHIGSEHTELAVEPDVAPILSELVWQWGEPFGDSSMIPSYLIAREARKHATVVLTGDGGDEAFAGYSRHLRADRARRLAWLTPLVTRAVVPAAAKVVATFAPRTLFARNFDLAAKYLAGSRLALAGDTCWFDGMRDGLYTRSFRERLHGFHPLAAQARPAGVAGRPQPRRPRPGIPAADHAAQRLPRQGRRRNHGPQPGGPLPVLGRGPAGLRGDDSNGNVVRQGRGQTRIGWNVSSQRQLGPAPPIRLSPLEPRPSSSVTPPRLCRRAWSTARNTVSPCRSATGLRGPGKRACESCCCPKPGSAVGISNLLSYKGCWTSIHQAGQPRLANMDADGPGDLAPAVCGRDVEARRKSFVTA